MSAVMVMLQGKFEIDHTLGVKGLKNIFAGRNGGFIAGLSNGVRPAVHTWLSPLFI